MLVTDKSRLVLRINSLVLVMLLLGITAILGFLSTRYHYSADWTSTGRHTLSEASTALLARLVGPVAITAYAREDAELRGHIQDLVDLYNRKKPDVNLRFVNPDAVPDELRQLGISTNGELVVRYADRSEHVQDQSEEALSNALQRLFRGQERWIVFLSGHGERNPFGNANHDLGQWARQLVNRGLKTQALNLGTSPTIPDNTSVLVIASPQVALLPGESAVIGGYIDRGGNLLWLADPGPLQGLEALAEKLGIQFEPGTLVDPDTKLFRIDEPAMVLVNHYGAHPALQDFKYLTVFPFARAIKTQSAGGWRAQAILSSGPHAWAETGKLEGEIRYDEGSDRKGPLDIGISLTRGLPPETARAPDVKTDSQTKEQRVVVIGDGDFLADTYLANGGNLELGARIMNWLASDDQMIAIPARTAPDATLDLSETAGTVMWLGFMLVLPLALVLAGLFVWLQRRNA